jgi:hypothetical protein
MPAIENAVDSQGVKSGGLRWKRVLLGAVLSEAVVIATLLLVITAYTFVIAPGKTDAEYNRFAQLAGYYVAPATGAFSTFAVVLWIVVRGLRSGFVQNGLATGVVSVLLTAGFLVTAAPEHRAMYVVAFVLRIAAGYAAGVTAKRRFAGA